MSDAQATLDNYVLGRGVNASIRLNLQHFLWKKHFGYLLHPSIPINKPELRVADVATGTAIWLLDLADDLSPKAELYGFDIDTAQVPAEGFLPQNVKIRQWDIFKPFPQELEEQFDIVNLRLVMLVVSDAQIGVVLRNLVRLLRPGGWIQWAEVDMQDISLRLACAGLRSSATERLLAKTVTSDSRLSPSKWVSLLGERLRAEGLTEVQCHRISGHDLPSRWQSYVQEIVLGAHYEIADKLPPCQLRDQLLELLPEAVKESRAGATWTAARVTWVGHRAF